VDLASLSGTTGSTASAGEHELQRRYGTTERAERFYRQQVLDRLNDRILAGCDEVIRRHNLPGYSVGISSKGCVTFSPSKIVDYETFKENQDAELSDLAWLFNMNRGIFMTPGREEEWTLSVTHTEESVDRYVEVFAEMAAELTS